MKQRRQECHFDSNLVVKGTEEEEKVKGFSVRIRLKMSSVKTHERLDTHTSSIAFRHLPPRKDVVNQCLEFDRHPHSLDHAINITQVEGVVRGEQWRGWVWGWGVGTKYQALAERKAIQLEQSVNIGLRWCVCVCVCVFVCAVSLYAYTQ